MQIRTSPSRQLQEILSRKPAQNKTVMEEPERSPIRKQVDARRDQLIQQGFSQVDRMVKLIQEFGSNLDGNLGHSFSSPAEAGDFAKMMNGNLQSSVGQYVGALQSVKPEYLEKLRKEFGDDFIEGYVKRRQEDFKAAKSLLEADQAIIAKAFNITGKLVEWGDNGYPRLGQFALSGHGIYAEGPLGAPAGASAGAGSLVLKLVDYQAEADKAAEKVRETKGLGVNKLA
jgi:hypothetical protein